MNADSATTLEQGERVQRRIIGEIDHGRIGPTFLAQGGIHGNEPSGVVALRRVLDQLRQLDIPVFGKIIACSGNLSALAEERRFVERDLNRQWLSDTVARLREQDPSLDVAEDREQRELLDLYQTCYEHRRGPLVFLDLHSSSADGPPFTCMADTIPNRRIADAIPAPMILGLEECIDGAVMEWFNTRGQIGVAIEGGRHDADSTVDNLESAVWLALVAAGVVPRNRVDLTPHRQRLLAAARGVPHIVEIRSRHAITPEDRFSMVPGYVSFQPITAGELLAQDRRGSIRSLEPGMILLPLYQGQGEDGFFTVRRVRRFWFEVSGVLRRLRLGTTLRLLPGVHRSPDDPNTLLADPSIARWLVVQVFHLFGFRRERPRPSGELAFSRRWAAPETWKVGPRRNGR